MVTSREFVDFFVANRNYLLFGLILSLTISLAFVPASGEEERVYDEVDRDSYTSAYNTMGNYGSFIYLYCGAGLGQFDTLMHFTLANRPVTYRTARLCFSTWSVRSPITLSIWTVSNSWSEDTITFENQPFFNMLLMRSRVTYDGWCQVDVTDFVRSVNEISFCLTAPNATDFMYIYSREYRLANYTPYIEWTFDVTTTVPGFDPWVVIGFLATISAVIGFKVWKFLESKYRSQLNFLYQSSSSFSIDSILTRSGALGFSIHDC